MNDWQARAACRNHPDPGIFFPATAGSSNVAEAKKVCAECTVRVECLDYAVKNGERHGVWGGMGEIERARHVRKQQRLARARRAVEPVQVKVTPLLRPRSETEGWFAA